MNLYPIIPYIGAGLAAIFGLGTWQYQLIAKRRYEVVEQALIATGEAVQTLHFIRRSETDDAAAAEQQPDGLRPGPWLTAYGRIQASDTQFLNLRNSTRSIAMHFGEKSTKSFDELLSIYDEICQAHGKLYFRRAPQKLYPTAEHLNDAERWKATLNQQRDNDTIRERIEVSYSKIKSEFGKYLHPNPFRLFLPFWK